jgi:hypothetical protein
MNTMMSENETEQFYTYLMEHGFTAYAIRKFRTIIYRYYSKNARDTLPWRNTTDPYHIPVSEVMLQQTQIERVLHNIPCSSINIRTSGRSPGQGFVHFMRSGRGWDITAGQSL